MIAVTNGITTKIPGMTVPNEMSIAAERRCVHRRTAVPWGSRGDFR
jgi:hypothetical protein